MNTHFRPTAAFVGASWSALIIGMAAYLIGLWNARMQLNEKGYYLVLLLYGLFAAISLQKPCATARKACRSRDCTCRCAGSR